MSGVEWYEFKTMREAVAAIEAERALADDLAAVLSQFADDWLGEDCEGPVSRVLTRYRETRQRSRSDDEIQDAIRMEGEIG